MKQASSQDRNVSDYDKEFTDIGNIINRKVNQMEQNQHAGSFTKRLGLVDGNRSGNKMSKRQQRSMKELNAIQSLEVWEEILNENALTADDFDASRTSDFDITLRQRDFTPAQSLSARKRSRKSSMYGPRLASDSWMKSRSIECLADERRTIEQRHSQMPKLTSYSEWDLADSYDNNIKDHIHVIDMYINGNIVNLITGSDFYGYDKSSLVKCSRRSSDGPNSRRSAGQRVVSRHYSDPEEVDHIKPTIVDVVFKESYVKYSLNRAEREGDVPQTKFWLLELEKTLNTKFRKEEFGESLT